MLGPELRPRAAKPQTHLEKIPSQPNFPLSFFCLFGNSDRLAEGGSEAVKGGRGPSPRPTPLPRVRGRRGGQPPQDPRPDHVPPPASCRSSLPHPGDRVLGAVLTPLVTGLLGGGGAAGFSPRSRTPALRLGLKRAGAEVDAGTWVERWGQRGRRRGQREPGFRHVASPASQHPWAGSRISLSDPSTPPSTYGAAGARAEPAPQAFDIPSAVACPSSEAAIPK